MSRPKTEQLVSRIMESVPKAPLIDDAYVSRALMEEAARRKRRAQEIGISAYLAPEQGTLKLNKQFLGNMIRDVESHNRREEVDDCWRQNDMIKKAKVAAAKASSCQSNPVDVEDERRFWAEQKAIKLAHRNQVLVENDASAPGAVVVGEEKETDLKWHKKEMKEKKKKNKSEKKKKKKSSS